MSTTTTNLTNINFMSEERYNNLQEISDSELYAVKIDGLDGEQLINQNPEGEPVKVWTGTKAEYDSLEEINPYTIYNITDEDTSIDNTVRYNIGDIFYSMRTEDILNGAVVCDGSTYNISDYSSGDQSVRNLLRDGKLPYVSLETYSATITSKGVCRCFGYDADGETFRVPTLSDVFIETGTASSSNEKIDAGLPNITGWATAWSGTNTVDMGPIFGQTGGALKRNSGTQSSILSSQSTSSNGTGSVNFDASNSNSIYGNSDTVQPNSVKYRAYVQLATDTTDSALQTVSSVVNDVTTLQEQMEETVNYGNITNCVTEIPQDIKLELNNGVLTLKAGSKVYVPNGFESDGTTPKFDEIIIQNDVIKSNGVGSETANCIICYDSINNILTWATEANTASGADSTITNGITYNTTTNKIQTYSSGSVTREKNSLPVGFVSATSGTITSIKQVFNGFGYIGSTVFVLPGVKGLIPNGRNEDGILKNITCNITNVRVYNFNSSAGTNDRYITLGGGNHDSLSVSAVISSGTTYYDKNENWFHPNNTDYTIRWMNGGKLSINEGKIVYFNPKTPFHSLDYSESPTIAGWAMPSNKYIDLSLGASGTSYTAPANGWFCVGKSSTGANQHITMRNDNIKLYTNTFSDSGSGINVYIPVKKSDVISIDYTASGTTNRFVFIYAEGEN